MVELTCGDCFDMMNNMPDNSVDMIMTDPPYKMKYADNVCKSSSYYEFRYSDKMVVNLNDILKVGFDLNCFCEHAMRIMKEPNIYVWCNKAQIIDYFNFFVNDKQLKYEIICWHKSNSLPTYSNKYLTDTEYCLYFHKNVRVHPECYDDAKTYTVMPVDSQIGLNIGHPNIKPLGIIERLIRNSSCEGDVVFDPFMGSGTTGVACKHLNRNFIGCEINPKFYQICEERINGAHVKRDDNMLF